MPNTTQAAPVKPLSQRVKELKHNMVASRQRIKSLEAKLEQEQIRYANLWTDSDSLMIEVDKLLGVERE